MGVKLLFISVVCTFLSIVGLQYWTGVFVEMYKSDSLIVNDFINSENASNALELLLGSYTTLVLVASFALNLFLTVMLGLKMLFFSELSSSELRKLLERLVNYIIYKGTFLPLVVPPTIFQAGLWSTWLAVLCFLKMFQAIARDRLERLNASPSATPGKYFRVYSALLLVFILDVLWYFLMPSFAFMANNVLFISSMRIIQAQFSFECLSIFEENEILGYLLWLLSLL